MTQDTKKTFGLRLNILLLRISRNWLRIVITILAVFVALPFIAPTLMSAGLEGPGRAIYTLYSPFCHQFGFRSFYLFGDQPVYPREVAQSSWTPYEAYTNNLEEFAEFTPQDDFTLPWTLAHKNYFGNDDMGYKVALCERDIFMYIAILTAAVLYYQPYIRQRLRPLPLWIYVIAGVAPIGLDGFSQLLSYPPFEFWDVRETLPVYRVLTGAIFGFMTAWLGLPYIDISMQETRHDIEEKFRRANISV